MSGDQFGWGVNMGRPCKCCGSEECLNINSSFCTPWVIEYDNKSDGLGFFNVNPEISRLIANVNVPAGFSSLDMIRCPQFRCIFTDPFWQIYTYTDCFGRVQPVDPTAVISNPFYYSLTNNNYLGDISITIKKIVKLKSGHYSISINGFDSSILKIVCYKACYILNLYNCPRSGKTFYYPSTDYTLEENIVNSSIISGPEYLCESFSSNPLQIPIIYPQHLKTEPHFPNNSNYLVGDYSIIIDNVEDSFLYIEVVGEKVTTVDFSTRECTCSDGRSSTEYENITVSNPEDFLIDVSINPLNSYDISCSNKVDLVINFKDNEFECS